MGNLLTNGIGHLIDSVLNSFYTISHSYFEGNYCYLVILLLSGIYALYLRKANRRAFALIGIYTILVLITIVYNPIVYTLFPLLPSGRNPAVVLRLWILCPFWLIVAFSMTDFCVRINRCWMKIICIVLSATLLVISGESLMSLKMINDSNCVYKIRSESCEIVDELLNLSSGESVSLFIFVPTSDMDDKFIEGGTIYEGIYQYSGKIIMYPYYYTEELWNDYYLSDIIPEGWMDSQSYINIAFTESFEPYDFDYAALPDNEIIVPKMDYCGYELVGHAGGYFIFSKR